MSALLGAAARRTLTQLIRHAFPHPTFPDGPYQRTADKVVEQAGADPRLLAQLLQGLDDLDRLGDAPFTALDAAAAGVVLRGVADTPFFRAVVDIAVVALYDDHEVWELLGYEGPSFDKGGYLNRGFNDLDWLPEPRIEEVSA
ncbi:hypothetical protein [Pseudonocardia sp. GCM10023141]|uniref:hypothetical protein n=1 Tax=Pseudonocardia sp. GCM10023141 TaxID=3252653 RepID=UPI003621173D